MCANCIGQLHRPFRYLSKQQYNAFKVNKGLTTNPAYESSFSNSLLCYTNNLFTALQSVAVQTTASPVPALVLELIATSPPTAAPTYSPLPSRSGQGDLLQEDCITPDYILLDGPTAYWTPVVRCVGGKLELFEANSSSYNSSSTRPTPEKRCGRLLVCEVEKS